MEEDDISLKEYFLMVVNRKKIVVEIFILFIIAAVFVQIFMNVKDKKSYTACVNVGKGYINYVFLPATPIVDISADSGLLSSITSEVNSNFTSAMINKISRMDDSKDRNPAKIYVEYSSSDSAKFIAEAIAKIVVDVGNITYQNKRYTIEKYELGPYVKQIEKIEEDKSQIESMLAGIVIDSQKMNLKDVLDLAQLKNIILSLQRQLADLISKRDTAIANLSNSVNFSIQSITCEERMSFDLKKKNIIMLSLPIIGLLTGIFVAIFLGLARKW